MQEILRDNVVPMLTLYCDDSGTHVQSDVAVAGCLVASVEQWEKLKEDWDRVNARERFGVFHMADFVARQEQFSSPEWAEKEKRSRTIQKLINIIRTRVQYGISCAVVKSAYDEVVPDDLRRQQFAHYGTNHYTFAIRHCIAHIQKWRMNRPSREPIQWIFDRLSKGRGEIDALMTEAARYGDESIQLVGFDSKDGWSFQSKSIVTQLQAADIWAWENYWFAINCYFRPRAQRKPMRASYIELLRRPSPLYVRYHTDLPPAFVHAIIRQFVTCPLLSCTRSYDSLRLRVRG